MTKMSKDNMSDHKAEYYQLNAKLCRLIEAHPCMYDRSAPNYMRKDYVDLVWARIAAEVNDTVGSCKERWRNIRTAYARSVNIYKTPSGPNRHKRYYLHDELQFLTKHLAPGLPSLRILTPTELDENHENSLQSIDQTYDNNCTYEINLDASSFSPSIRENIQEEEHVQVSEPEPEPEPEPELELETEPQPEPEPEAEPEPEPEPDYVESSHQAKKRRRNIPSELPIVNKPQNRDPDSEFLKSLMPEMKTMNSRQKILFKAKIFQALEEVFSDSKDFPQKDEPMMSQSSFRTPATRRALARRFFGNKNFSDRRLPTAQSTQAGKVSMVPTVQLPQPHNEKVPVKQEHENLEIDD